LTFDEEKERLDSFAITLTQNARLKGYIVVYAGKVSCSNEAQLRANRARDYVITTAKISKERVIALNGGYRETTIERLYVLGPEDDPPDLVATVAPNRVQIVSSDLCKTLNPQQP
jgi:hypothetical protein